MNKEPSWTQEQSNNYFFVLEEVKEAYADCWLDFERGQYRRNLYFRSSRAVPAGIAAKIMAEAVPKGYNNFHADLLNKIKGDVIIAREGSVCVYVQKGATIPRSGLEEDERHKLKTETRLWWD